MAVVGSGVCVMTGGGGSSVGVMLVNVSMSGNTGGPYGENPIPTRSCVMSGGIPDCGLSPFAIANVGESQVTGAHSTVN